MSKLTAICHKDVFEELGVYEHEVDSIRHKNGGYSGMVSRHLEYLIDGLPVTAQVCPIRLFAAFESWHRDIERVRIDEMDEGPLDHFKRAAYMSYWLRRRSPVIVFEFQEAAFQGLSDTDKYYVDFLNRYVNEHLAYTLSYEICLYFERAKKGFAQREDEYAVGSKFVHDLHYSQREKNVSPHAMNLILRAIFAKDR